MFAEKEPQFLKAEWLETDVEEEDSAETGSVLKASTW